MLPFYGRKLPRRIKKTEVENIVTSMEKTDNKSTSTRYYNGVLPSSNYPGFNESRVNLIEW